MGDILSSLLGGGDSEGGGFWSGFNAADLISPATSAILTSLLLGGQNQETQDQRDFAAQQAQLNRDAERQNLMAQLGVQSQGQGISAQAANAANAIAKAGLQTTAATAGANTILGGQNLKQQALNSMLQVLLGR